MAGNASLTTQGFNGLVKTDLWLQSINTGSDMQLDDNQVKRGMSFRPIRRGEMFIDFSAVWSLQRFDEMDAFQEQIRNHFLLLANGSKEYMTLHYNANQKTYHGWIETAQKQYIRFQDLFIRQYRMNILLPQDLNQLTTVTQSSGFLPSANFASLYGPEWYKVTSGKTNDQVVPPKAVSHLSNTPRIT